MNTPQGGNASSSTQRRKLPVNPSLEHLQKHAKRRVKESPALKLTEAQHQIAQEYGCKNWAELAREVKRRLEGANAAPVKTGFAPLPEAANNGDIEKARFVLDAGNFTQHDLDLALARSTCTLTQHPERRPLAKLLLERGANPNGLYREDYGPIVLAACECIDLEGLSFLIDAGADVSFAPFKTKDVANVSPMNLLFGTYVRGRNVAKHACIDLLIAHGAVWTDDVIMAIHRGDAERLRQWIEKDSSLMRQPFGPLPYAFLYGNIELRGATLLHYAVEFGERESVDVLLDKYADIKAHSEGVDGVPGPTPLFHAIGTWEDSPAMLEHLLKRVGEHVDLQTRVSFRKFGEVIPPVTPLEYAQRCLEENKDSVNRQREVELLRSADHREKLRATIKREDVAEVARMLDEHPDSLSPNLWPVAIFQTKSLAITRLLLDRGLNPDECSAPRKPLHLAVYQCLPDIVELLVERGADVNLRNPLGETPLDLLDAYEPRSVGDPDARRIHDALLKAGAKEDIFSTVRSGDVAAVGRLLDERPELINAGLPPESGIPPLSVAARSGRAEVARFLLKRGADVNAANDKLNTPLWFACQSPARVEDRIAVAKVLLDAGANINQRCEDGTTALHFAAWRGPEAMVEFLLTHGARDWIGDDANKLPLDHAKNSVSPDKEEIVRIFSEIRILDPHFRSAVDAIDDGSLDALQSLLRQYPYLGKARAEGGRWAGDYFRHPTLLHFVANNPHRSQTVVANIGEITQAIIDAGADVNALTETEDGIRHTTLDLVASSSPARNSGVQNSLMDLLLKNGSTFEHSIGIALSNEEPAAAHYLFQRGIQPDLVGAAGLGLTERFAEILKARPPQKERLETAMATALQYGHWSIVELLLERGFSLSEEIIHAGTPLHHAALKNQKALCEKLIARGASLTKRDRQWNGTPADWAFHGGGHEELSEWLREQEKAAG